jgi:hypothetical protein
MADEIELYLDGALVATSPLSDEAYTFAGLDPNKEYALKARRKRAGLFSAFTSVINRFTRPRTPDAATTGTRTASSVQALFDAPEADEIIIGRVYNLADEEIEAKSFQTTGANQTVTGLDANRGYKIRLNVRGVTSGLDGAQSSALTIYTRPTTISAPAEVSKTSIRTTVSYQAIGTDEVVVLRRYASNGTTLLETVEKSSGTSHEFTGLTASTQYKYTATRKGATSGLEGTESNQTAITTNAAPSLKRAILTSTQTWDKPSDWNDANNTIHAIGGGGAGGPSSGRGGGGGAYARVNNFTISGSTLSVTVGAAAAHNGTAGDSFVGDGTILRAKGGQGGNAGGAGGAASASIGSTKFNGGQGGDPQFVGDDSHGGGGGGAGGTAGHGSAGATASGHGGAGGAGGAASGGAGGAVNGGAGGNGTVWTTAGAGGGGGGGFIGFPGGAGGNYGAGGGGAGYNSGEGSSPGGGVGKAGVVVIEWTPAE